MKRRARFLLAAIFLVVPPLRADTLVFAAASLTDVLNKIGAAYEKQTGKKVETSYAASSALARQIEAGAPASLFISADLDWMEYLQQRNLIAGAPVLLAGNQLVLIAPASSDAQVSIEKGMNLAPALGTYRLATGDPESVPVGKYAKAALEYYGAWETTKASIMPTENVRAALKMVESGEAALGIVYATDAKTSTKVRVVDEFPAESHQPIVYPGGLVKGHDGQAATDFFLFLQSETAAQILEGDGFTKVTKQESPAPAAAEPEAVH